MSDNSMALVFGESADDESGWSVSSAGDVNGDGLDDLIVGAYQATPRDKSLETEQPL
jgi:hypothetical protein